MHAAVFCRGLPRAARRLSALLTWCLVMAAPWPAAAADGCQVFADPLATPTVVTVHNVIGTCRRLPVENAWHTGSFTLAPGPGERLVWTNTAGVSWTLTPDLGNQRQITWRDEPYQRAGDQDGQGFTLAFQGNAPVSFRFNSERHAPQRRFDRALRLVPVRRPAGHRPARTERGHAAYTAGARRAHACAVRRERPHRGTAQRRRPRRHRSGNADHAAARTGDRACADCHRAAVSTFREWPAGMLALSKRPRSSR